MSYTTFKLVIENKIATLSFNRPEKANSLNMLAWREMKKAFQELDSNTEVRCIILAGEGKLFCAGIDLQLLMGTFQNFQSDCEAKKRDQIRGFIRALQGAITAIEECRKPVLAAIHNGCIGGGVDIVSACDIRYCTEDAYFTIKEIDLGLVADIGTLQRMPTLIPAGLMAELAFTGRKFFGKEALTYGFVNKVYSDKAEMMEKVNEIATVIAEKSPLCIRGTKEMLLYKRDHSVQDSLANMVNYNASMLISADLMEAFQAFMEKRKPTFKD